MLELSPFQLNPLTSKVLQRSIMSASKTCKVGQSPLGGQESEPKKARPTLPSQSSRPGQGSTQMSLSPEQIAELKNDVAQASMDAGKKSKTNKLVQAERKKQEAEGKSGSNTGNGEEPAKKRSFSHVRAAIDRAACESGETQKKKPKKATPKAAFKHVQSFLCIEYCTHTHTLCFSLLPSLLQALSLSLYCASIGQAKPASKKRAKPAAKAGAKSAAKGKSKPKRANRSNAKACEHVHVTDK